MYWQSQRNKFVFIDLPCNAPRAFTRLLTKQFAAVAPEDARDSFLHPDEIKAKASCDSVVFTVVRHPFTRLIAFYHDDFGKRVRLPEEGFAEFVERLSQGHYHIRGKAVLRKARWFFRPQTAMIEIVAQGIKVKPIKLEVIDRSFSRLPFVRGSRKVKQIPVKSFVLKDYFTEKAIVENAISWAGEDFERFGYEPTLKGAQG